MKFSEATAHAVSLLNILEEDGATPSDMLTVGKIFSSLAKAHKEDELSREIHSKMKSAVGKKSNEFIGSLGETVKLLASKKKKPGPAKLDDLKVPDGKLN